MKRQYLTDNVKNKLHDYQQKRVDMLIDDFIAANVEAEKLTMKVCPKCGAINPRFKKGGTTSAGKQMLRCCECNHRSVIDHGQLTFYSHQSQDKWNELICDTIEAKSIKSTAALIDVHETTAFRMRHKLLNALEQDENRIVLQNEAEFDEKYFCYSHKGKQIDGKSGKKRGTPASKRGLSGEQVCLLTGVERQGQAFLRAYNLAKPTSEDIMNLVDHIQEGMYAWIDGLASYRALFRAKHCQWKELVEYKSYDRVNHLNNVNSFHKKIEDIYNYYRGVSTKYINRYSSLFCVMRDFAGMDRQEILTLTLRRLRKQTKYFFVRQISNEEIFTCMPA